MDHGLASRGVGRKPVSKAMDGLVQQPSLSAVGSIEKKERQQGTAVEALHEAKAGDLGSCALKHFMPSLAVHHNDTDSGSVDISYKQDYLTCANLHPKNTLGTEISLMQQSCPVGDMQAICQLYLLQEEEDENVEENEEYQEGKLRFAGGRKEEATYDAGDEEDKRIAADARREAERQGGEEEVRCEDMVLVWPLLFASKRPRTRCRC